MKTLRSMYFLENLIPRTGVAPSRFARRCAGSHRYRVEAVPAEGMTLRQTNQRQHHATDGSVRADGFGRIVRARGIEPARAGKERRKQQLIGPEQAEQAACGERWG